MPSTHFLTSMRSASLLCAAVLLAAGAASAQTASASSGYSSSQDFQFMPASFDSPTPGGSLPGAPAPANGGGQYDNRGGGSNYGGHGLVSRLTWEAGGGANGPTSDSSPYITWGGNFTLGGGLRFNRYIKLLAEYQFIDDKLPGAIIAEAGATGGNAHIWSFTLDPVIDLMPRSAHGVYITGGGGFYRKVTNFTDPEEVEYCSYYYCGIGTQNEVVGHFSSNQGGWNIGGGYRYRMGGLFGDGKTELFAEARFLWINTPAVTTQPNGLGTTTVAADTKLIPITLGVRF